MLTREHILEADILEIKEDFLYESAKYKLHRSTIEDAQTLRRIDALLDEYWDVTLELCYEERVQDES